MSSLVTEMFENGDEECEKLTKNLLNAYNDKDDEKVIKLLSDVQNLIANQPNAEKIKVLDLISLPLGASCVICGCFSTSSAILADKILTEMSYHGPPREVFTALADGISSILEYSQANVTLMLPVLIKSFNHVICRISRKKDKFITITFQLLLRILDYLEDIIWDLDLSKPNFQEFLVLFDSLLKLSSFSAILKQAFVLQITGALLRMIIWSSMLENNLQTSCEVLCKWFQSLWDQVDSSSFLGSDHNIQTLAESLHENSEQCDNDTEQGMTTILVKWNYALVIWANQRFNILSIFAQSPEKHSEILKWIFCLLNAPLTEKHSVYHCAGIELIDVCFKTLEKESDVLELSRSLVHLMDKHPVIALKLKAHSSLQLILQESNESLKWTILSTLVFTKNDEIAALMVQAVKDHVVLAFDRMDFNSVFMSKEVVLLLLELLKPPGNQKQWTHNNLHENSATLNATVNLCIFLVIRESSMKTTSTDICTEVKLKSLKTRTLELKLLCNRKACKAQNLQTDDNGDDIEQESSVKPLSFSIDKLLSAINNT